MGHQVNFYVAPDDIDQIESEIRKLEPLLVVHSRSSTPTPRTLSNLRLEEAGLTWLFYFLVRESDVNSVVMDHVPEQGYWSVNVLASPVVEFTRCFFDGKILRRGREYYLERFYDRTGAQVEKGESFRVWAAKVLKTTKRVLQKEGGDYVGPAAAAWREQTGGTFVG